MRANEPDLMTLPPLVELKGTTYCAFLYRVDGRPIRVVVTTFETAPQWSSVSILLAVSDSLASIVTWAKQYLAGQSWPDSKRPGIRVEI